MSYFTHITSTVVITKPYKRQQNITTMAVHDMFFTNDDNKQQIMTTLTVKRT